MRHVFMIEAIVSFGMMSYIAVMQQPLTSGFICLVGIFCLLMAHKSTN